MHDQAVALATALAGFVVTAGLFTLSPGLDTALVLRVSTTAGVRAGWAAVCGIGAGLLVWGLGAAFGITALMAASGQAFNVLKWVGAAYLFYTGGRMFLRARRSGVVPTGSTAIRPVVRAQVAFRQGFSTNILNPKVGIFYVTFLPQFIPQGVDAAVFSGALALTHVAMTLAWFGLLVAMTAPLGRFLARPAVITALDRLTGGIFMGFGVKLALASHRPVG